MPIVQRLIVHLPLIYRTGDNHTTNASYHTQTPVAATSADYTRTPLEKESRRKAEKAKEESVATVIIFVHLEGQMSPSRQRVKETIEGEIVAKAEEVSMIETDMIEMRGLG